MKDKSVERLNTQTFCEIPILMDFLKFYFFFCVFVFSFFLTKPAVAENKSGFHICYFSSNNENEVIEMKKFSEKINKVFPYFLTVDEYIAEGGDPEDDFLKLMEFSQACDAVVFSGHHTGAFGGARTEGSLRISFLEKLSCNEEYRDWFKQVKALWLQGCRTLGVEEVISEEEASVEYHTNRVGAMLDEDHLEQSLADLSVEFSATLDQDNPLSERYLRVFPSANIFGWTKTAPGEKAGSQYSIPFHIAQVAKQLSRDNRFPKDSPLKRKWSEESTIKYMEAISAVLGGEEHFIKQSLEAWRQHGNVRDQSTEYGFLNPDLNAYPSLMSGENEILKQSKHYNCLLWNSQGEELLEALGTILENPEFIRYIYDPLLEILKKLNEEEEETHSLMIARLKESGEMNAFLAEKLTSDRLGILRKIDYYAFYEEVYGRKDKLRLVILNKVIETFKQTASNTQDERDYKVTLLSSLSDHNYLNSEKGLEFLTEVIESESDPSVRSEAVRALGKLGDKALPLVERNIQDAEVAVREAAAESAVEIGRSALATIERALRDPDLNVRAAVLNTTRRKREKGFLLLEEAAAKIGENTLLDLIEQAVKNIKKKSAQFTAVDFAGRFGEKGIPILELVFEDSDNYNLHYYTTIIAAELGEIGLPVFKQSIKSLDKSVRIVAVEALGKLDKKGLPFLRGTLDTGLLSGEEKVQVQSLIDKITKESNN